MMTTKPPSDAMPEALRLFRMMRERFHPVEMQSVHGTHTAMIAEIATPVETLDFIENALQHVCTPPHGYVLPDEKILDICKTWGLVPFQISGGKGSKGEVFHYVKIHGEVWTQRQCLNFCKAMIAAAKGG